MIYVEIEYTGKKSKDGLLEFYLVFSGQGHEAVKDRWTESITELNKSIKDGVFRDIYFISENPGYMISREFVLKFLANEKFTPVSSTLFYKK